MPDPDASLSESLRWETDRLAAGNQPDLTLLVRLRKCPSLAVLSAETTFLRSWMNEQLSALPTVAFPPVKTVFLTNICELKPTGFAYARQAGQPGAWVLERDQIGQMTAACAPKTILRLGMGGFHSSLSIPGLERPTLLATWEALLSWLHETGRNLTFQVGSLDDIAFLSEVSGKSSMYVLDLLKAHEVTAIALPIWGLLDETHRTALSPKLISVKSLLALAKAAAQKGLPVQLGSILSAGLFQAPRVPQKGTAPLPAPAAILLSSHWTTLSAFAAHLSETDSPLPTSLPFQSIALPGVPAMDRHLWLLLARLCLNQALPHQKSFAQIDAADPLEEAQEGTQWGADIPAGPDSLTHALFLSGSATWWE